MKTSLSLSVSSAGGKKRPPIIPVVTAISPSTRYTGGGQSVTLTGTGLKHPTGTTVTVGGTSATVVSSSWHSLTFTTPAKTAATYDVVVTNALGSSAPISLTYVAVSTADLTSISPTYGPAAGGTTITATGTFVPEDLAFTVNGIAATSVTYVNATTATFVTPAQADANGSYDVVVSMYGVGNTDILGSGFTARRVPVVTSLNVTKGPIAGSTTVQVTGQYFVSATYGTNTVVLDGQDVACTYVSSTRVDFTTPAHAAGAVTLAVRNVGGTSNTLANAFTYYAQPTITASDTSPKTYAQAARLTVSDSTDITGGTLGGTSLTGVSIVDATHVDVTFPAKSAGTYNLVLTGHPGGTTPNFSIATVNTIPVVTSVSPNEGATGGGTSITITGTGFANGNADSSTIGASSVGSFTVVNDTTITGTTPSGSLGAANLVVSGPAGSSSPITYTYSGFLPTDIPTLIEWWDPNVNASSALWEGVKGAHDFEQTTAASRPTKLTADADLDGNDGFQFDGSNDFFVTSANITFGKFEIWIVKKSTSTSRLWIRDDGAATIIGYGYQPGGPHGFVKDNGGLRSMVDATSFVANPAAVHLHSHRYDGHANHVIASNNADYSMSTIVDESPNTASQSGLMWIGSYLGSSEFSAMKVGDIFIFSEPLSAPNRAAMWAFLQSKYASLA